jgi:hypothetical protein
MKKMWRGAFVLLMDDTAAATFVTRRRAMRREE